MNINNEEKIKYLKVIVAIVVVVVGIIVFNTFFEKSNNPVTEQATSMVTEPTTEKTTEPTTEKTTKARKVTSEHFIDVPYLNQNNYPSGCEVVSATMVLNYFDYDITTKKFIDDYLPMQELFENKKGEIVGPDYESMFVGSPYKSSGLGCFPPVIEYACNNYLKDSNKKAVDVTGATMNELIEEYIIYDIPVLIWGTIHMVEPYDTLQWVVEGAKVYSSYKDGDICKWPANEHCMVFTGYDETYYYFNDPLYEHPKVAVDKATFEHRYEQIGKHSLVIK